MMTAQSKVLRCGVVTQIFWMVWTKLGGYGIVRFDVFLLNKLASLKAMLFPNYDLMADWQGCSVKLTNFQTPLGRFPQLPTNWMIANKWFDWDSIFWDVSTCFCVWPYDKARYLCWVQTSRTAFPSMKRPSLHCATGGEPTPRKHPEFTRTHALVWSDCNNRTH